MNCKICSSESEYFANGIVLNKYNVSYFRCPFCGFIQTETPYWLEEAYSQKIASTDIGLVARNIRLARMSRVLIRALFDPKSKFLDYGGGYGLFVRIMRDSGFDYYLWEEFVQNLFATGFEADPLSPCQYELVTAFEVFEHFVNPLENIAHISVFSKNIFFSTRLIPSHNPRPGDWSYYGLEHGQHISFYSKRALSIVAEHFGLHFLTDGEALHLFTNKNISPALFRFLLRGKVAYLLDMIWKRDSLLAADFYRITGRRLD